MTKTFSTSSFVLGVMAGLLLAGGWFFFQSEEMPLSLLSSSQTASSTESNAVSVENQTAGDTVHIASVTVPSVAVWVAVREASARDLGNILGAGRVAGSQTAVEISLLRATVPGRTYAVELYRDDNDGVFDVNGNSVYIDFDTGVPVISYFTTTE